MKVLKNVLSLLIVNLIFFLLIIILVEGLFRVFGIPYKVKYIPNENSFARFDPYLGWSYIPDKSAINKTGNITRQVHFDAYGFRVPSSDSQSNYSKPSILFIGGSFTMGHGLSYEESFAGRFDSLQEGSYQVLNSGVQGFGSDQALISLKKHLTKFNIKIVVYTFIEDHIYRNGNYDRRMLVPTARFLGTKPQFELSPDSGLYLARKPLLYKDYFNSFLIDFLKMRIGSLLGSFPPHPEELTKALILEMMQYCRQNGAHFVVLNWRWTDKDYDLLFYDLDVDVIDTMEEAPEDWDKMVLFEGTHPNAQASDHAAMLLLKYFRTKGLVINELEK